MGNIKLCESEKKTEIISVKCTKQEKCKLEMGAAKKGKSLSAYVLEGGLIGIIRTNRAIFNSFI